ncbi:MAG: response regulator transcription factor [Elusimicrobia bacterium]|jgi:DNA-binding response OmpR family regulator|nr:response regulator transcription factor [Elusimicrobiota bacterium]
MDKKKKILIVDDDIVFLETVTTILKEEDFEIFEATTAESGFEVLVNNNPDLIILDKNLPDKSGFEVLKSIRKSKDYSKVPVMIITADTAVSVDEAFDKGADDCIFKPLDVEETIKRIKQLLK